MVFTSTLRKVTSSNGPWPLHDAAASRQMERTALLSAASSPTAGATASASASATNSLMERAGVAVARLALALTPHARRVQIWCGPGNNGGDGLVAARHLQAAGWAVQVQLLADAQHLPADAAQALHRAQAAGVAIDIGLSAAPQPAHCVIDALLGLGSNRAPCGDIATAIAAVNGAGVPTLSIDLPSGLHPDTGALLGDCAVHATATLSLLTLKPGCFTGSARDHAGQLWLDTLGADAQLLHTPSAWLSSQPPALARQHASHKGSFGDVAVVGGSAGMTGAAWLAARAASAAGAGRVYCSLLDHDASLLDRLHPELMGRRAWWLLPPAKLAATTVACGCGAGDGVRQALPPLLAHVPRLVLDADALNAIAGDSSLLAALRARSTRGLDTLLTPHPLEAARLLGIGTKAVQADRLQAAQALAHRCQATVLLKGSGTVVAAPSQAPTINATGNGALATAGTGDVLAGWAAGLWAQQPAACARDVASAAVWRHGQAADDWLAQGHTGPLRASDLVEALAHRR